jgi:hypothetical protein
VRDWAQAAGPGLLRENLVPNNASEQLAQFVSWFDSTQVEVHYPGVWLADGVWATHGHYLNRYLRPVSSYGIYPPRQRIEPSSP